jgi:uncharacterized protein (DUF1697 family)
MGTRAYAALLRAVNVGGTGKLAMGALARLCERAGFASVETYLASGNVVFTSASGEASVKADLERALRRHAGRPIAVQVRTGAELQDTLAENPFPAAAPSRVIVLFLEDAPPKGALAGVLAPDGEELVVRRREVFIHYPRGQGASKLRVPLAAIGTGRNLNTVAKLAAMTRALR